MVGGTERHDLAAKLAVADAGADSFQRYLLVDPTLRRIESAEPSADGLH